MSPLSDWANDDVACRVAWNRLADPGDATANAFRAAHGVSDAVAMVLSDSRDPDAHSLRSRWQERLHGLDPRRDLHNAKLIGARVVLPGTPHWPDGLDDLDERAPACLWAKGPAEVDWSRCIAVVGSRASTPYGNRMAAELGAGIADAGVVVVSGGAYGIDAAAHRGVLAADGTTVAILAGGLDRLYPRGNEQLLAELGRNHLLLSEAAPGVTQTRWRFLERNRLIAAAAQVVIVVEAAWRSGALNTVEHAGGLGRSLGAVPGPVTSASSAGCHKMLREQHATCITDAAEALELAGRGGAQGQLVLPMNPVDLRVYDAMRPGRTYQVPALAAATAISEQLVLAALGRLSLTQDVIRRDDGWRRTPARTGAA